MSARGGRRFASLLVVWALVGACTSDAPAALPSAQAAAGEFVSAWNEQDYASMAAQMSDSGALWTEPRLKDLFDKVTTDGSITSLAVSIEGRVSQPRPEATATTAPVTSEVPYEITYDSAAARRPITFEGSFTMDYDAGEGAWSVVWKRSLLWPESPRAAGFDVTYRWGPRGAILDRNRRPLARRSLPEERSYPYGALAGSTVGSLEPLTKADLEDGARGAPGDLAGGSGLEAAYDEKLAGVPASRLELVDKGGETVEVVGHRAGEAGASFRTTLDVDVQRAAENAYGDTVGGAVVMDPKSGDLLAIVSSSPFDPNNYVGVDVTPFNRALSGLYPPGSSMKVVTAAAALDSGTMTPETAISGPKEYQGVRNFEGEHFVSLSFASALKYSVNTAFAQVALKLGGKTLARYAKAFGFNRSPSMPLGAATSSFPFPQDSADLMFGAIGQAQVLATPLEMASVAATVANDGKRMEPRISFVEDPSGERAMSKRYAEELTEMMVGVVQGGTGSGANVSGLSVAGKTGTAEVDVAGKRKNHAWFICFAPAEDPVLAVAVVSELGGVGGEVAAPIARQILLGALPYVD